MLLAALLIVTPVAATFTVTADTDDCLGTTSGTFSKALADASADTGGGGGSSGNVRSTIEFTVATVAGTCVISQQFTHSVTIDGGNGVTLRFNGFTLGSTSSLPLRTLTVNITSAPSTFTGVSTSGEGTGLEGAPVGEIKLLSGVTFTSVAALTFDGTTALRGVVVTAPSVTLMSPASMFTSTVNATNAATISGFVSSTDVTVTAGNIMLLSGARAMDSTLTVGASHHVTAVADALVRRSPVNVAGGGDVLGTWNASATAPSAPVLTGAYVTGDESAVVYGTVATTEAWTIDVYARAPGETDYAFLASATGTGSATGPVPFEVPITNAAGSDLIATHSTATSTSRYSTTSTTVTRLPLSFASSAFAVDEDAAIVEIVLTRPVALGEMSVALHTVDSAASAPADYIPFDSTVTFAANATETTLTLIINDDNDQEGDEDFTIALGETVLDTQSTGTATITILDDESPRSPNAAPNQDASDGNSGCNALPTDTLALAITLLALVASHRRTGAVRPSPHVPTRRVNQTPRT